MEQDLLKILNELKNILKPEILDELPFDISERINDLFEEMELIS